MPHDATNDSSIQVVATEYIYVCVCMYIVVVGVWTIMTNLYQLLAKFDREDMFLP